MAFNTGNPVGSTDPRDFSDNAENFDKASVGSSATFNDRLGVPRKSLAGMEAEFNADQSARSTAFINFLNSSGYEFLGEYAASIEVTAYNQIIRESGEFWRPAASTTLPYTTTGAGMPEGGAFVAVGDAALRQELGSGVFRADLLANLEATPGRFDGDSARLMGRSALSDGGQGNFRWDSSDLSSTMILSSVTSTSVDDTTDTITSTAHGLEDGDGVVSQAAVNGLSLNTVYYVVNATTDTYQLSETFGGVAFDLTGTANFTVDHLLDPLKGVYVTSPTDLIGTGGAWVRSGNTLSVRAFGPVDGADVTHGVHAAFNIGKNISMDRLVATISSNVAVRQSIEVIGDETTMLTTTGFTDAAIDIFSDDVTLYKLGIDGQLLVGGSGGIGSVIRVNSSNNVTIAFNEIKNGKRNGVELRGCNNCSVINNDITESSIDPDDVSDDWGQGIAVFNASSFNSVSGNRLKNQGSGVIVQSFVTGEYPTDNIVSGNVIDTCHVYGVVVYRVTAGPSGEGADRNIVSGNSISNISGRILNTVAGNLSFGAGIYVLGSNGTTIIGNKIDTVNTNTDSETLTPAAIGTSESTGVTISGNDISNADWHGIALFDVATAGDQEQGSVVCGNRVFNALKNGIFLKDRGDVSVASNQVSKCSQGVFISSTDGIKKRGVAVSGNQITNITNSGITGNYLLATSISGNNVESVGVHGISVASTVNSAAISGNSVRVVGSRGIEGNAVDSVVSGNTIKSAGTAISFGNASGEGLAVCNGMESCPTGISSAAAYLKQADNKFKSVTTPFTGASAPFTTGTAATTAVNGRRVVYLTNGDSISAVSGMGPGDDLTFMAFDGVSATIVHGTGTNQPTLSGGVNYSMPSSGTQTVTFIYTPSNRLIEVARS